MSNIVDEALDGTLTEASLAAFLKNDPMTIDTPGGKKGLTPLAAAASVGKLAIVNLLLQNHAKPDAPSKDGQTPLLIATRRKLKTNQAAIVSALLKAGAAVDRSSKNHDDNTPLMNAIVQLRNKTIASELVDHGADVTLKNSKGQSAQDLAKELKMERDLRPRSERTIFKNHLICLIMLAVMFVLSAERALRPRFEKTGHLIVLIMSAVMFVLSAVNGGVIEGTVKGVLGKLYKITGNKNTSDRDKKVFQDLGKKIDLQDNSGRTTGQDLAAELTIPGPASTSSRSGPAPDSIVSETQNIAHSEPNPPEQISLQSLEQSLDDYLEQNNLRKFFTPGDNFLKNVARKAAALASNPNSIYSDSKNVKRLTSLSLYQPVIYCDDSGSMKQDHRYENQGQIVDRISRIATKIVPDDCGVDLRFINNNCDKRFSAEEVATIIKEIRPAGTTKIGTHLRSKILDPLVYKAIEEGTFKRPVLVPSPTGPRILNQGTLSKMPSLTAGASYRRKDTNPPLSCSLLATTQLRNDHAISDMLYCTTDSLDDKFKELKAAHDRLEEWLLKTLTTPIISFD